MAEWIESLGYLGAFLGAIVEGEVVFIAALQTVRLGYLDFYYVLLAVFLGAQVVDWSLFLAARRGGQAIIDKRPKLQPRFDKMSELVERRSTLLLLAYRFMYGFRIVLPTLFGISSVSLGRFALLSFIGTLLWVLIIGYTGFFFSENLMAALNWLSAHFGWALLAIGLLVLARWAWKSKMSA